MKKPKLPAEFLAWCVRRGDGSYLENVYPFERARSFPCLFSKRSLAMRAAVGKDEPVRVRVSVEEAK